MTLRTELVQTEDQWERLEAFAASFDHFVNRSLSYVVYKDQADNWLAYLALIKTPVGIPAVKPGCSPQTAAEIAKSIEGWFRIQYGHAFFLAPQGSAFEGLFTRRGAVDQQLNLWYLE